MDELSIRKLSELDDRCLEQTVRLFIDGFLQEMMDRTKFEAPLLVEVLKQSFLKDHYYVGLLDHNVVGILAVSTEDGRSHVLDKRKLQRELGFIKGGMIYTILYKELQRPMNMPRNQCYIESVTTDAGARGKGVASKLLHYLFDTLPYDEFVLEVADSNVKAIMLYDRLGFVLFKKKKADLITRMGGIRERLYMKKIVVKS
jgi:ribosomal protein S18 acetylase RimI-like enzyme